MAIDYTCFTLVFEGDPRKLPNPFTTDSPWGRPYAVSVGDALQEADRLRDQITALNVEHDDAH